jgi:FMN-dependent oxidoreductase (nitrilotriacetate monooxygenase family)
MIGRQAHLGVWLLSSGHNIAAWRHPASKPAEVMRIEHYLEATRIAARGKLDMIFFEDTLAARERNGGIFGEVAINSLDPMMIIAALSAASEGIGLAASYSTTYHDPYLLASKIASIDHLSKGRAAWNVVTTDASAGRNFSDQGHPDKDLRYAMARETIDIVRALWDSWDDAAVIANKSEGLFYDLSLVRPLNFQGRWNTVKGPLNLPRPPQGRPVFIQAGMSETGMDFAASFAEVIFCQAATKEQGQAFRDTMRAKAMTYGRDPDTIKTMPGFVPIVASTDREAREKEEYYAELVHPNIQMGLLSERFNMDLSGYKMDAPFPLDDIMAALAQDDRPQVGGDRRKHLANVRSDDTLGSYCRRMTRRTYSHVHCVGGPETIADFIGEWVGEGACDGFILLPWQFPLELDVFVDQVVPVLQKRGLFRKDYRGETLRDHFGLPFPPRR